MRLKACCPCHPPCFVVAPPTTLRTHLPKDAALPRGKGGHLDIHAQPPALAVTLPPLALPRAVHAHHDLAAAHAEGCIELKRRPAALATAANKDGRDRGPAAADHRRRCPLCWPHLGVPQLGVGAARSLADDARFQDCVQSGRGRW